MIIAIYSIINSTSYTISLNHNIINQANGLAQFGFLKGWSNNVCLYGIGEKKITCMGENQELQTNLRSNISTIDKFERQTILSNDS